MRDTPASQPFPEVASAAPTSEFLAQAFFSACLAELQALKPGNVHVFADGHNMLVDDFVRSAHAAAAVIARPESGVGRRILDAVEATWAAVGCNTNLGIVLLAAPLLHAALTGQPVVAVLQNLDVEDADLAFRAILRASPAGLGSSPHHDVRAPAAVTLLAAMQASSARDRIAYQYANGFSDVFEFSVPLYREAMLRWGSVPWATTAVYLGLLSRFPDSHVMRKYGAVTAEVLRASAEEYRNMLQGSMDPESCTERLLEFDASLKRQGLNPGTSADLTVATLLVIGIEKYLKLGSK